MRTMNSKTRWSVLLLSGMILACALALVSGFGSMVAVAQGQTQTLNVPLLSTLPLLGTPTRTPTPTATREVFALTPPPTETEDIPDVLKTLNALNSSVIATLDNRPTPTLGPSELKLEGLPLFVDFWAAWCAPCRAMRPHVEAMETKYKGQIAFWKIDTDNLASRRLVREYEVVAIPLVVLLDANGKVVLRLEGYRDEAELDEALQYLLSKSGKLTGTSMPPAPTATAVPRNSA